MLTVERGVTLRTIESYRRDLDLFEKFLGKLLDQERSSDKGENVSEMSNETAGHHYTPREVIRLMVNLIFSEEKDKLKGKGLIRSVYDPACGTGGMLTIAKEHIHKEINKDMNVILFGQEENEETYAVAKSDMLISGENPDNIKLGTSFSKDGFLGKKFDYMFSNPPFGVSWKKEQNFIKNEAGDPNGRFSAGLPSTNDGALLFLQHMI